MDTHYPAVDPSKKRKADENGAAFAATDGAPPLSHLLTPDDARKIIEPLNRDQLLDILKTAVLRHGDVLADVRSVADGDPSKRKLFVRGLGWETTTDKLRSLFSAFGELEEAIVITDKATGRSKGYGFVTFKHVDGALVALKEPSKKIDGRMTVTQLASAGISGGGGGGGGVDVSLRKIYVGNVPFEISSERLLAYFSAYGEIEEGPLGFDKQSGKAKGFAFFVYKTEEGARASLVDPIKTIDGHQVMCKLAVDGKKGKAGPPTGDVGTGVPPPGPMPGSLNTGYGVPGTGGYGGFSGLPQQNPPLNSPAVGGPAFGTQGPASYGGPGGGYGAGLGGGGGYGGSQYGGSAVGEYGGLSNVGSGYRLPPSSVGMQASGYPDSGNYGLNSASSGFPTQMPQPPSGPRVPPGGMYQGIPPYF
ncbi:UBP1-associated protein 2C-like [Diospyros lotus]|uniref:UBP1-associated protein 2C-like n=1 Tax=Diospyros lotus TaxID=55363 RepID=UPI002259BD87|nr:UBP1-associated protein 2C-like [Diospyros lotus]XP_052202321.1 UBP1-associated protein 2C-like [Diospyros lotus]